MPYLKLLGGALVEDDDGRPLQSASRRHPVALLAILARAPAATLSRSKAVGLLWPESTEKAARNRLGTCVHRIRREVGEGVLLSIGDDLRLDLDALRCDATRFEAALGEEAFGTAVELYRGAFLDGFYVPGAPEFERWVEDERDRLKRAYWQALESLAETAEGEGDATRAAAWWRRRFREDPYDTRVATRLMTALAEGGSVAEALSVGRGHEALLRNEVGATPGAEFASVMSALGSSPATVQAERDAAEQGFGPALEPHRADSSPAAQEPGGSPSATREAAGAPAPASSAPAPPELRSQRGRPRRIASILVLLGLVGAAGAAVWYLAGSRRVPGHGDAPPPGTRNAAALELYRQGEALDSVRPRGPDLARRQGDLYRRAVELDPRFAPAWAGLAETEAGRAWFSAAEDSARAWSDSARAAAQRALDLDPRLARAHAAIGSSYWAMGGHTHEQMAEFSRALELDPTNRVAVSGLVVLLESSGRIAESMRELDRATARPAPAAPHLGMLAVENAMLGRDDVAEAWLAKGETEGHSPLEAQFVYQLFYRARVDRAREIVARMSEDYPTVTRKRAEAAVALYAGDWTRARSLYRQLFGQGGGTSLRIYGGLLADPAGLAWSLSRLGRDDEAREIADEILEHWRNGRLAAGRAYLPLHQTAVARLVLGDTAGAFDLLERSVAAGFRDARVLRTIPTLEPLRGTPRFAVLVARMDTLLAEQRRIVESEGWGVP